MLTEKQERFCQEFMVDGNATQAAVRAGYSCRTARAIGTENLAKPAIKERIDELRLERAKRVELEADEVIRRLREIADSWRINPSAAVRALELLGRHLGIFERDNRQAAPVAAVQVVLDSRVAERMGVDDVSPIVASSDLPAPDPV